MKVLRGNEARKLFSFSRNVLSYSKIDDDLHVFNTSEILSALLITRESFKRFRRYHDFFSVKIMYAYKISYIKL